MKFLIKEVRPNEWMITKVDIVVIGYKTIYRTIDEALEFIRKLHPNILENQIEIEKF